jgi:hypothetical protein
LYFRLLFAYTVHVWNLPTSRLYDFSIQKGAVRTFRPVETIPDAWIIAGFRVQGGAE